MWIPARISKIKKRGFHSLLFIIHVLKERKAVFCYQKGKGVYHTDMGRGAWRINGIFIFLLCPRFFWIKSKNYMHVHRVVFSCLPVRCEDNWAASFHDPGQSIPQETASNWVHASSGFIL